MKPTCAPLTQAALLRRRCLSAVRHHRQRARADGVALPYGLEDLVRLAGGATSCAYCGRPVGWDVQFDHSRPTARGGAHALGNLAPACPRCNALKGQLDAGEFAELLALLARLHPAAAQDLERRLLAGGVRYRRR